MPQGNEIAADIFEYLCVMERRVKHHKVKNKAIGSKGYFIVVSLIFLTQEVDNLSSVACFVTPAQSEASP